MLFDLNSAYILILLCLSMQYNLFTDSRQVIIEKMVKRWKEKKEISYYENYFGKKATIYVGSVSAILFIFVFYKCQRMKLIISITIYYEFC